VISGVIVKTRGEILNNYDLKATLGYKELKAKSSLSKPLGYIHSDPICNYTHSELPFLLDVDDHLLTSANPL